MKILIKQATIIDSNSEFNGKIKDLLIENDNDDPENDVRYPKRKRLNLIIGLQAFTNLIAINSGHHNIKQY